MEDNKREMTLEEVQIECARLAEQYDAMRKLADDLQKKSEEEKRLELERQRATRKREIDEARKALDAAQEHWSKLMQAFRDDYGYFYVNHNGEDCLSKMIDFFLI